MLWSTIFQHSLLPCDNQALNPPTPAFLPPLLALSPCIAISIRILWRPPFLDPMALLPYGSHRSQPWMYPTYISTFSLQLLPGFPQVPEKIIAVPSLSSLLDFYSHSSSLSMALLQSLLIQSSPQAPPPPPSQDNFTCATEKMQAIAPPPPTLAMLPPCIHILFPSIHGKEGLLSHWRSISPPAGFDLLFSRLCGHLRVCVFSIPLHQILQLQNSWSIPIFLKLFDFWFPLPLSLPPLPPNVLPLSLPVLPPKFLRSCIITTSFPYPLYYLRFHSNCSV